MRIAKLALLVLVTIAVVLVVALLVVWGLDLSISRRTVNTEAPRVYSEREREEILSALEVVPQREYTDAEQQEILKSLKAEQ